MQAAERIFEGQFDNVEDEDGDTLMDLDVDSSRRDIKKSHRLVVSRSCHCTSYPTRLRWQRLPKRTTETNQMMERNQMKEKMTVSLVSQYDVSI
jgi:hypothetical protein